MYHLSMTIYIKTLLCMICFKNSRFKVIECVVNYFFYIWQDIWFHTQEIFRVKMHVR